MPSSLEDNPPAGALADALTVNEEDPSQTIVPVQPVTDAAAHTAATMLDRLTAGAAPRVKLEKTLGEGGMGIIKLAEQVALGRPVAVKSLRPSKKSATNTTKLLHEAWVIGSLEHPNVVPVYDIDVDSEGAPLVVLKRIEGVHWGTLMGDAEAVKKRFGAADLLEWNLSILMQVLNAVRFAHSREIIHRDLKPENVMIGEFGEVYLVDWGLAMSLQAGDDRLPNTKTAKKMAGTPRYMAPEMLSESGIPLSERTDVYLAGAVLYQVLTGKPPHQGSTAPQLLFSIVKSNPPLPESVPERLAAICRKAMHKDPRQRFASAEEMRLAVQGYLQHRGSERLAERASVHLRDLEATLAGHDPRDDDIESRQNLYRLFGALRFGFRESLTAWPENREALESLNRAIALMIEYELRCGDPRTAATLVSELPDPPADLRRRIDEALAAKERDKKRLEHLEELAHALDAQVGRRVRLVAAALFGVAWVLSPWLATWLGSDAAGPEARIAAYTKSIAMTGVLLLVCIGLALWARKALIGSVINRRWFTTLIFVYLLILILQIGMLMTDAPHMAMLHARTFCVLCIVAMVVVTMEHRFWPAMLGYIAAFVAIGVDYAAYSPACSLANLVIALNSVVIWRMPNGEKAP